MLATSSILSIREDSSNSAGFRLTSIAIASLVPLAGPILVPILLDKLKRAQRDSGLAREEAGEAEEARDGSAFAMIAAESMLVVAALGIPASLKLGGYENIVIILIFAGLYGVALGIALILIVRRILANRSRLNGNGTVEFELVKGNDEAMDVDDVLNRSNARGPLRRSNTGSTTLYDSKEGTYEREGEEDDNMQRTGTGKTKSKLRPFFLAKGAGVKEAETGIGNDSAEALPLVALLKARQPRFV